MTLPDNAQEDGRHILHSDLKQLEVNEDLKKLVNIPDDNGWCAIHSACSRGDLQGVRLLIDAGADVNVQTNNGQTPLHYAVSKGHLDVVRLLVTKANLSKTDQYGQSVFHRAASKGNVEVAQLLQPPQWQMRDSHGNTPLHFAAEDAQAKFLIWVVQTCYQQDTRYVLAEVKNKEGQSVQDLLADQAALEEVRKGLKL